jgi:hypothetical protein
MLKSLLRSRMLLFLVLVALLIRLFSTREDWVERYYTYGLYPYLSVALRYLIGWIPFSLGDALYFLAGFFLLLKFIKVILLLVQRRFRSVIRWETLWKYLSLLLWVYIIFNIGWGLNYNRQGIASQLDIEVKAYNAEDVWALAGVMHQRLNFYAARVDSVKRQELERNRILFGQAAADFEKVSRQYPFLRYNHNSLKPSLYGTAGKYFGYTGYYNPFTAESQIKTSIPVFVKPFVTNHEIAHGLGYAKENEANFVSWLACKNSDDVHFRYSAYYEMFHYAFVQSLRTHYRDSALALYKTLHPRVTADLHTEREYHKSTRNVIEPLISDFYDQYMKLNNQPKGKITYSEVTAWLIGYMKKYGAHSL